MGHYRYNRNLLDRLADSFQQHLSVEGIFALAVNIALILAIAHYLVIPLAREVKNDLMPAPGTELAATTEDSRELMICAD